MSNEMIRSFKTALAAALLTTWAFCRLLSIPLLGDVPLLWLSMIVQCDVGAYFFDPMKFTRTDAFKGVALVGAIFLLAFAAQRFVGDDTMKAFVRGPLFIAPIWILGFWFIVRRGAQVTLQAPGHLA